jgi:iron complex outermembrane receptor protein
VRKNHIALAIAVAFPLAFSVFPSAFAQTVSLDAPVKALGVVTVNSGQPTSLPTQIPTTIEGVTREQIEQTINATDSEDALKYLPSLLVRKRYVGDYNHAVLSSRASGTGNSARSAVYADGILLSNYLGNGASYAPRWGMVSPEQIERVDVMYGPFSAAYPGNSVGAVVDYVTRMPTQFETHAQIGYVSQSFKLYNTDTTYHAKQASASVGNKSGAWSWWLDVNRTDSAGQPLVFATKLVSTGVKGSAGSVVTGAVEGLDKTNAPWLIMGTNTQYSTEQNNLKAKIAYDFSPTVRASYTLGYWDNTSEGRPTSYLKDAQGNPVYSGKVNVKGRSYDLGMTDFNLSNEKLGHVMHGLSVKSNTKGEWDWEAAASLFDYNKDQLRAATTALPGALQGGAGTIADQGGTGWNTLALKGTWRPGTTDKVKGAHIVDFGFQQENYKLHNLKSNIASNWIEGVAGSRATEVGGKTSLQSLYAQDTWSFNPQWKAVLGARVERWTAQDGFSASSATNTLGYASRNETFVSPKAALAFQATSDTVIKASTGRAVRMPTVAELYGATSSATLTTINDPNLKPEKSWTTELSVEKDLGNALLRATVFRENVKDSLYSQSLLVDGKSVSRVQNVDAMRTNGIEVALSGNDVLANIVGKGLDLSGSVTYADSRITANQGFVSKPGDTIGKYQPRVPVWRATALVSYRFDDKFTASVGARYSGKQFSTLDNSDVNGFAYTAASKYFTVDLRARYQFSKQGSFAFGIDNVNNYQYWNFHPYPQRSYSAQLKFDL